MTDATLDSLHHALDRAQDLEATATDPAAKTAAAELVQGIRDRLYEYTSDLFRGSLEKLRAAADDLSNLIASAGHDPMDYFLRKLAEAASRMDVKVTVPAPARPALVAVAPPAAPAAPPAAAPAVAPPTGAPQAAPPAAAAPAVPAAGGLPVATRAMPLTQEAVENACDVLGLGAPVVWAIIFTETDPPHGGFLRDRRPQILYEQHVFHRLTDGRYDAVAPWISSRTPGNYGASGGHQYVRLAAAMQLDAGAAIQSASWGIGQTMGNLYKTAGYATPMAFALGMYESEDVQLAAMIAEIRAGNMQRALAAQDWKSFARAYNGPAYERNHYDETLRSFYEKMLVSLPDIRLRAAQIDLGYLGYDPSAYDGWWGKRTASAINHFRANLGRPSVDALDEETVALIEEELAGSALRAA